MSRRHTACVKCFRRGATPSDYDEEDEDKLSDIDSIKYSVTVMMHNCILVLQDELQNYKSSIKWVNFINVLNGITM